MLPNSCDASISMIDSKDFGDFPYVASWLYFQTLITSQLWLDSLAYAAAVLFGGNQGANWAFSKCSHYMFKVYKCLDRSSANL